MAYDEDLTNRMRTALDGVDETSEKRMMGGVCFFLNGNMLSGADRSKDGVRRFMFRVGKDKHAEAPRTSRRHAHGHGRPAHGRLRVS